MQQAKQLVHGTCVAFGAHAALLRGGSGSGKSDLALRFLALAADGDLAPRLVADDQVVVEVRSGHAYGLGAGALLPANSRSEASAS